jgi:Uma2 family endonuclease
MQTLPSQILYPDSDGEPMADNTRQFRWIVTVKEGLEYLFRNDPTVFVAGDLLWYPVEGDPKTRAAPDALVVFGRPKGERGSYRQWEEDGIPPQVVFEILSPGNTFRGMLQKLHFYERFGVCEYYIYDPDRGTLEGFVREGDVLEPIPEMQGWVSPRLGIQFGLEGIDLDLRYVSGRPFISFTEALVEAEQERERAEQERQRADQAQQQAEQAQQQTEQERRRSESLAQKLRELGVNPDQIN